MRPFGSISASTFWKIHPDIHIYIQTPSLSAYTSPSQKTKYKPVWGGGGLTLVDTLPETKGQSHKTCVGRSVYDYCFDVIPVQPFAPPILSSGH